MNNELIKAYIGKICVVRNNASSFGGVTGIIVNVVDNWIQLDTNGKIITLNLDYVISVEEIGKRKNKI